MDHWDGNLNGFSENDKPDKWVMEFKPNMQLYKDSSDHFTTTFSNSPCWSNYCLRQSYPEVYPFDNNPKTGSFKTNMSEICTNSFLGIKRRYIKLKKDSKALEIV